MRRTFLAALTALCVAVTADATTTAYGLTLPGVYESNPHVAGYVHDATVPFLVVVSTGLVNVTVGSSLVLGHYLPDRWERLCVTPMAVQACVNGYAAVHNLMLIHAVT